MKTVKYEITFPWYGMQVKEIHKPHKKKKKSDKIIRGLKNGKEIN